LSEKPIASTAAVAGSLAALAEDRPTAVDFEFAELQTFRTMRELLNSGELGAVRAVNVAWVVDSWARRSKSWSWKTDATEGGGVLGLLAPHVVYLLEWLLGDISAMTAISDDRPTRSYTPPGKVAAANSVCMMGLAGTDATAFTVMLDNAAVGSRVHTWSVVCDAATLIATNTEADWVTGFVLDRMSADARQRITMEPAFDGDGRQPPMRAVAERFVEAVRTGGTCHPDFADGARVQSLIELVGDKSRGPTTVQAAHIPGRGEAL
jgi:predicted dehydrogenase